MSAAVNRDRNVDELICRSIHQRANRSERGKLLAWRRASADNERYYQDLVRLLTEATAVELAEEPDSMPLIEDLISPPYPVRRVRAAGRGKWLATGSFAAAAAVVFLLLWSSGSLPPAGRTLLFSSGEVVTGPSESSTVRLGDGTIVRLGPESRLRVIGDAGRREVWIEGRAYLAVAHDETRPFRVRTHAGDALVLGTRFDLYVRNDDLRVLVVEGAVKLDARGVAVDVEANQVGRVNASELPSRHDVDATYIQHELDWIGDFIAFERTPLSLAARELSVHYGIPVEVLDSTLARETVQGIFANESLAEVLRVLCRAVDAHCSVSPTGATIGP